MSNGQDFLGIWYLLMPGKRTKLSGKMVFFQNIYCIFNVILLISGRVPSVYRSSATAREDVCVHVVQPAGRQEEVLQEAREENVPGGGEEVQGGIDSGEAGGEAEVGEPAAGQAAEGYCSGMSRGFRSVHHGQETCNVRSLQSRPKRKNEKNRLSQTSRQGKL